MIDIAKILALITQCPSYQRNAAFMAGASRMDVAIVSDTPDVTRDENPGLEIFGFDQIQHITSERVVFLTPNALRVVLQQALGISVLDIGSPKEEEQEVFVPSCKIVRSVNGLWPQS